MDKTAITTALTGNGEMTIQEIMNDSSCSIDYFETCYANLREMHENNEVTCIDNGPGTTLLWKLV